MSRSSLRKTRQPDCATGSRSNTGAHFSSSHSNLATPILIEGSSPPDRSRLSARRIDLTCSPSRIRPNTAKPPRLASIAGHRGAFSAICAPASHLSLRKDDFLPGPRTRDANWNFLTLLGQGTHSAPSYRSQILSRKNGYHRGNSNADISL